ncbi:MAG: GH92 family glycosyl hydrolase [Bacteroides sp.]|nr:GH92 family glycosyl hydrolase [Bacteroides sp.]MCM1096148.1 GH92 family glycosyl hydrolase [Terasakiella sp.]
MNLIRKAMICIGIGGLAACSAATDVEKEPVDYVAPYIGNISHLLVPTFPTVHLPNSMLRVYPERADFTSEKVNGLPVIVTNHREKSAFNLTPYQGEKDAVQPVIAYTYDNEVIKPYYYSVFLDEPEIEVRFAPSHQSAVYEFNMNPDAPAAIIFNTKDGALTAERNCIHGYQQLDNNVRVYVYMESKQPPVKTFTLNNPGNDDRCSASGKDACICLHYGDHVPVINLRYGVSFISEEQARKNLAREIAGYSVDTVAQAGRRIWNDALGKIEVQGLDENDKTVFYTSLYRTCERPVCLSEDGRYFSASDGQIHDDESKPFYTDDWIWDTYRAAHPLRVITEPELETNIINSYLRMASQTDSLWMPTFPEITGDTRRMNSNHGVATVADALAKGLDGFDVALAYEACRKGIEDKTLAPWSGMPAGELDDFYKQNGYIPALRPGDTETVAEVNSWEKRQPVAVTLGTSYDQWCLSRIAAYLGDIEAERKYLALSHNYRNLFNPETRFFHPKDKDGHFIVPFDYAMPGGPGARDYYGENNGWVYRWDVPHDIADLITLMGGNADFNNELDRMFNEPLGRSKYEFFATLPDHTGNVGQFSMANEPALHIPYLYNYSCQPWMTQKRIRQLLKQWFRNDLMGIPGDEDGGGMSAFVAFSMLGFYPVTPGMPVYNIGSPKFTNAKIHLPNGNVFEIEAINCSDENKYIQSATLNGKQWDKPWFAHEDLINGGKLVLEMGNKANRSWGCDSSAVPPSASTI